MKILVINWGDALNVVIIGIILAIIILIMLFIVLRFYNLSITPKVKAPKPIIEKPTVEKTISVSNVLKKENVIDDKISAEINAAISMALHLYYAEVHDEESNKITIKTVERRYSPWSSKIYGLNNLIR